jgi:hypothetical protein
MRARRSIAAAIAVIAATFLALGPALSASADDSTTLTFSADSTQTVSYGTNWLMQVTLTGSTPYDFVTATSGTVNILIKGIPGNYATGLPLTPGGVAFVSPSDSQPALPAGTYAVTAVYVPSGTAYLQASQTLAPATLTVTPLRMSSSFSITKTTINGRPAVQVLATATPPSANAAVPPGSWKVTATDSADGIALTTAAPLPKNPAEPVTITLSKKLTAGRQYSVVADFVPAAAVAGGYKVSNGKPQKVTVESPSFGDVLNTPFAAPLWAIIAIGLGLAALIAAAIVLVAVASRNSKNSGEPGAIQPSTI